MVSKALQTTAGAVNQALAEEAGDLDAKLELIAERFLAPGANRAMFKGILVALIGDVATPWHERIAELEAQNRERERLLP
jgi:hypothetical protein